MKFEDVINRPDLLCGLPYTDLSLLWEVVRESEETQPQVEHAVRFCGSPEKGIRIEKEKGTRTGVTMPHCNAGEFELAGFHTHPGGYDTKSMGDFYSEMAREERVACAGYKQEKVPGEVRLGMTCHSYDVNHPQYQAFRDDFLKVAGPAYACNYALTKKWFDEGTQLTEAELMDYELHEAVVNKKVQEGIDLGIIKACVPKVMGAQVTVPSVRGILEGKGVVRNPQEHIARPSQVWSTFASRGK